MVCPAVGPCGGGLRAAPAIKCFVIWLHTEPGLTPSHGLEELHVMQYPTAGEIGQD